MEECSYCGETFEVESAYLDHLEAEHLDELGAIDRRRVESGRGDGDGPSLLTVAAAVGAVVLILGLLAGTYLVFGDSPGADTGVDARQTPYGSQHVHGTMTATIDGEPLDFANDPDLIGQAQAFHFHGGSNLWHAHAEGVTLEYALATLGIEVEAGGDRLTYDGTTYDDADTDTNVSITVDGEEVDPMTYVLEGVGPEDQAVEGAGDDVRVVVDVDE